MKISPKKLRKLRKEKSLTQKKLADLLGFNRAATISDFETGKQPITERTAKLIKAFLTK